MTAYAAISTTEDAGGGMSFDAVHGERERGVRTIIVGPDHLGFCFCPPKQIPKYSANVKQACSELRDPQKLTFAERGARSKLAERL